MEKGTELGTRTRFLKVQGWLPTLSHLHSAKFSHPLPLCHLAWREAASSHAGAYEMFCESKISGLNSKRKGNSDEI